MKRHEREPEQEYRDTHEAMERWVIERPEFLGDSYASTSQAYALMRHGDMMPTKLPSRRSGMTAYGKESKSFKPQGLTQQEANLDRYRVSKSIERIVRELPEDSQQVIAIRYVEGVTSKSEIERQTGIHRKGFNSVLRMLLSWIDLQLSRSRREKDMRKTA